MTAMNLKTRCQRTAPFLHRNWISGVTRRPNSVMGAALSTGTPKHRGSFTDEDHGARPLKRRRLSSPDSFDIDNLIASPQASEDRSCLRIEVVKLLHKDSKKVRNHQNSATPRDVVTTPGNCRITLYDAESDYPRVLHCQSQTCDIITYKNPLGPHRVARVDLPRPFYIPEENILINRLDDHTHDFAESYKLVVDLEAAAGGQWPPLNSTDFGPVMDDQELPGPLSRHWVMSSEFEKVFGKIKSVLRLKTGYQPQQPRQTDYIMDLDVRWTTGYRTLKRLDRGCKPSITAIDPDYEPYTNGHFEPVVDEEINGVHGVNGINGVNGVNGISSINGLSGINGINGVNGINGHLQEDEPPEPEDELVDGDQTPSRSLRTRERNKVYNLKVLSDQAQGKERKRRGRPGQVQASEGRVTYFLPVDQPIDLNYFRCIACGVHQQTLSILQAHLQKYHADYECVLETTSQGPQFHVTHRFEPAFMPSETYQLTQPAQPFNLQTFVSGDQSWITSRLGPANNDEPIRSPSKRAPQGKLLSDRPRSQSSQATQRRTEPVERKIIVPDNLPQPLFDPVSKARLKPGDEVPKPTPETAWLYHKHRECLDDYTDMTDNEVEYIKKWDVFILEQNLTSGAYFPRAWVAFARQEASWLVAAQRRMIEYSKHASFLLTRDVLDDVAINEAFKHINEARREALPANGASNGVDEGEVQKIAPKQSSPRSSQVRKGANGCTLCQLPVLGPRLLVCANKACQSRLYHADCIAERALTPVTRGTKWLCNSCTKPIESS